MARSSSMYFAKFYLYLFNYFKHFAVKSLALIDKDGDKDSLNPMKDSRRVFLKGFYASVIM